MQIIGRDAEQQILAEARQSKRSELIAVYGRRRVGKTYLVRSFYSGEMVFEWTGLHRGTHKDQLQNFHRAFLKKSRRKKGEAPVDWFEAFQSLEHYLDGLHSKKKKVLFIDEFPWIATPRSKFLMAFEGFWNQYASSRKDLIVVICGSAASYMVQKILTNKGGLHNRVTRRIGLMPFTLAETAAFLKSRKIRYTQYDYLQLYMMMGGIPHYLEQLEPGLSVAQNIDKVCFAKDGLLRLEFDQLFVSLFDDSSKHIAIIKALAKVRKGITRNDLIRRTGIRSGGDFSIKLQELIVSGFVSDYSYFQNKKHHTLYRLTDEYCSFYLNFIQQHKQGGRGVWQRLIQTPTYRAWIGFTFESVCLKHVDSIKRALRIDAIHSVQSSWHNQNAQIDLLIDRDDNVITVFEIKFHNAPFVLDKAYYAALKRKLNEFRAYSPTRKNVYLGMLTTYGVKQNAYSTELLQHQLDMSCLFDY